MENKKNFNTKNKKNCWMTYKHMTYFKIILSILINIYIDSTSKLLEMNTLLIVYDLSISIWFHLIIFNDSLIVASNMGTFKINKLN